DTGWGNHLMIERTIKSMIQAGAAAVHIEDQPFAKRCGHRKGKKIITTVEMVERIQAAVEARGSSSEIVIMARTDAFASEGMQGAIDRALAYIDAGADMIFPEALTSLEEYAVFKNAVKSPILANITEFGQTPLFTTKELSSVGVEMALYPLSANRAMNLAALRTLEEIRHHGTQKHLLETMQTREELYGFLNYEKYEQTLGTS
nr:isocitrate lyase/phosphoenolpyruvate mutase family protein [Parachlamydiaceae bacterium]